MNGCRKTTSSQSVEGEYMRAILPHDAALERSSKIFIVGSVGSGKSTLAQRLSLQRDLPWYELDCIVHVQTVEGRMKRTPDEQTRLIGEIDRQGPWIFEGVDRESYRCLYEMADTILFLDPPLWKRRLRIVKRYFKQQLGMEQSHYRSDLAMLRMMFKWTKDFERNRDMLEAKLNLHEHKVIRLSDGW
jgi:adenylate kinase family enzyme